MCVHSPNEPPDSGLLSASSFTISLLSVLLLLLWLSFSLAVVSLVLWLRYYFDLIMSANAIDDMPLSRYSDIFFSSSLISKL